jgi:RNA polymerase sigma-70 factor (ECF subfamily)
VDRQNFDALLLEHLSAALRLAGRLCGDPHTAEDAVHDAIVRAVGAMRSLNRPERFRPWFFQIVVNVIRDKFRKRRVSLRIDEPESQIVDQTHDPPPAVAAAQELGEIVAALVQSLPPRQREVLVLVAFEQMTTAEAAGVLGITDQNARTTLHLARQRLREQLAPYMLGERT